MYIPRYIEKQQQNLETIQTDILIVGSGLAGLYLALKLSQKLSCILVTKTTLEESNSSRAQGGMAAAIASYDSPELHFQDTLLAGAGLCEHEPLRLLVEESKEAIEDLIALGIAFDRDEAGQLALTQEGAHRNRRILHAGGDATGKHIIEKLAMHCQQAAGLKILENTIVDDLVTQNSECNGAFVSTGGKRLVIQAKATILATGGAGQLFSRTTNPLVATGDGIALALRAGAELQDLEFVQFHPTALSIAQAPSFLISEAVRGEGAYLRNEQGKRFMHDYHPLAELAPRDIVARAIHAELKERRGVFLDLTHFKETHVQERFPTIYKTCVHYGLNPAQNWIPISPAAHYMMGGVRANTTCETNIAYLYVCGEVACSGLHGANRLASNSLTEAVVFGKRLAEHLLKHFNKHSNATRNAQEFFYTVRQAMQEANQSLEKIEKKKQQLVPMTDQKIEALRIELQERMLLSCGIVREKVELNGLLHWLESLNNMLIEQLNEPLQGEAHLAQKELYNMVITAYCIVHAAIRREESRGAHYRLDFPSEDTEWRLHLVYARDMHSGQLKERKIDVVK